MEGSHWCHLKEAQADEFLDKIERLGVEPILLERNVPVVCEITAERDAFLPQYDNLVAVENRARSELEDNVVARPHGLIRLGIDRLFVRGEDEYAGAARPHQFGNFVTDGSASVRLFNGDAIRDLELSQDVL